MKIVNKHDYVSDSMDLYEEIDYKINNSWCSSALDGSLERIETAKCEYILFLTSKLIEAKIISVEDIAEHFKENWVEIE